MAVQSAYGNWLMSDALYSLGVVAGAAALWGTKGVTTSIISALYNKADADAEAARQAAFYAGARAQDAVPVKGQRHDLIGKVVTIVADRLGYEGAGATVFVIGADETTVAGCTVLTVIKRL